MRSNSDDEENDGRARHRARAPLRREGHRRVGTRARPRGVGTDARDRGGHRRPGGAGAAAHGSAGRAAPARAARRHRRRVPRGADVDSRRRSPSPTPADLVRDRELPAHRRHHRHPEAGRANARERGIERVDDACERPPGPGQRHLRGAPAVPHQRAGGDRAGATAQGPACRVGRAAWLSRPPSVPELLADRRALSDRLDVRRSHGLRGPRARPGRRRHLQPEAAARRRRAATARSGRRVPGPHRRRTMRRLWPDRGHVCQRAQLARRAPPGNRRAAPALPAGARCRHRRR